jgi:hypothetical protein
MERARHRSCFWPCERFDPDLVGKGNMQLLQLELMRRGQYILGYKLKDPMDLIRCDSVVDSPCSPFELGELPLNGPPKVLIRSLAQMIPLPKGPLLTFEVGVEVVEPRIPTVQLCGSTRPYNYTPEVILAEKAFELDTGDHSLDFDFAKDNLTIKFFFGVFLTRMWQSRRR